MLMNKNPGVEKKGNQYIHVLKIIPLVCDCYLTLDNSASNALSKGFDTCG